MNRPSGKHFFEDVGGQRRLTQRCDLFVNLIGGLPVVAVPRLARLLGEPVSAFRLCDTSALSPWVRDLFVPYVRACPACAAAGYHSLLMSLRALEHCPIHELPLLDKCRCGARILPCTTSLASMPGLCPHCGSAFFTRGACRRPWLARSDAQKFKSLADWLEATSSHVLAPQLPQGSRSTVRRDWFFQHAQRWTEMLGREMPKCLGMTVNQHSIGSSCSQGNSLSGALGKPLRRRPVTNTDGHPARRGAKAVYSAMDRHIRRHVLDRKYRSRQARFVMVSDGQVIHHEISSDELSRKAWLALLWSMHIEHKLSLRFNRKPRDHIWWEVPYALALTISLQGLAADDRAHRASLSPFSEWIEMHAAETALVSVWRELACVVDTMVSTGEVYWGHAVVDTNGLYHWVAVADVSSQSRTETWTAMHYADVKPVGVALDAMPRIEKHRRKAEHRDRTTARAKAIAVECAGNVLRYDDVGNWSVAQARTPDCGQESDQIVRHKLLAVPGRPQFYLYRHRGDWVARLRCWPIEVCSSSPASAIGRLRGVASMYCVIQAKHATEVPAERQRPPGQRGANSQLMTSHSWRDAVASLPDDEFKEYVSTHYPIIRERNKFWRCAAYLHMQLKAHLERRNEGAYMEERTAIYQDLDRLFGGCTKHQIVDGFASWQTSVQDTDTD